jgi:hypothetical protein
MYTTEHEKNFVIKHLNKTQRLLEYGSGTSTELLAQYVNEIVSIEHNQEWATFVQNKNIPNAKIVYAPTDLPYIEGTPDDGSIFQFRTYVECPLKHEKFDVVFIDGRARVECAKFAKNIIKNPDCDIFIHDFFIRQNSGENYKEILKYLKIIDSVQEMCRLRII